MEINVNKEGTKLCIALTGRLDTNTSPKLDKELSQSIGGVTELVFDFASLDYISSAGLRIILAMQKKMNKFGSMVIKNVNADIMEVFELTGFADILTIE